MSLNMFISGSTETTGLGPQVQGLSQIASVQGQRVEGWTFRAALTWMMQAASRLSLLRTSTRDLVALVVVLAIPLFWFAPFAFGYFVRLPREFLLASGGAFILSFLVLKKNLWLGLLLAAASANAFVHSLTNRIFFHQAFYVLLLILGASVFYLWATKAKTETKKILIYGLILVGCANSIYALLQFLGMDLIQMYGKTDAVVGFMDNPGLLGILMAFIAPFSLAYAIWALPLVMLGLFLSKSILGLVAATIACLWLKAAKISMKGLGAILLAVGLVAGFNFDWQDFGDGKAWAKYSAGNERLKVWKATAWLWPHHVDWSVPNPPGGLKIDGTSILMGWGLGSYYTRFVQYDFKQFKIGLHRTDGRETHTPGIVLGDTTINIGERKLVGEAWRQAHNEYVQILFEMGAVGAILALGFLGGFFKRLWTLADSKRPYAASVIAVLITAIAHFPFHIAAIALPFVVMLGFLDGDK